MQERADRCLQSQPYCSLQGASVAGKCATPEKIKQSIGLQLTVCVGTRDEMSSMNCSGALRYQFASRSCGMHLVSGLGTSCGVYSSLQYPLASSSLANKQ